MSRNTRTRPLAPTHALDHALEALASGDPEGALRWAVPALADEGSGAAAADIIGRTLVAMKREDLAADAFELAIVWLARLGLAPHAVAAALALRNITGDDKPLRVLASAFGAEARTSLEARPPALHSDAILPLESTLTRDALVGRAVTALQTVPRSNELQPARVRLPLWSALPTRAFERFAKTLQARVCKPGDAVMREGEVGSSAFIVARGEVRVSRGTPGSDDELELAVLGPGAIVGEMALVTDAPRYATVVATRGALLLEAPRDALDEAAREVPDVREQVVAFCHRRLVDNLFRTSSILREVPANERDGLAQAFETQTFERGEALITEGATGGGLHLLAAGEVEVRRADVGGETLRIATLGPGTFVGEISLVLRRPATASVIAVQPSVSLVLPAKRFLDVVKDRPNLLARLYELAVRRDDETSSVVAQEAVEIDDAVIV